MKLYSIITIPPSNNYKERRNGIYIGRRRNHPEQYLILTRGAWDHDTLVIRIMSKKEIEACNIIGDARNVMETVLDICTEG